VALANGYSEKCPEVWIEVDTIYVKGKVVALVMNSPFAELIIGNYTRVGIPAEKMAPRKSQRKTLVRRWRPGRPQKENR
jgi:hypothetical protein